MQTTTAAAHRNGPSLSGKTPVQPALRPRSNDGIPFIFFEIKQDRNPTAEEQGLVSSLFRFESLKEMHVQTLLDIVQLTALETPVSIATALDSTKLEDPGYDLTEGHRFGRFQNNQAAFRSFQDSQFGSGLDPDDISFDATDDETSNSPVDLTNGSTGDQSDSDKTDEPKGSEILKASSKEKDKKDEELENKEMATVRHVRLASDEIEILLEPWNSDPKNLKGAC